ncbi:ATP-binding protein [Streptomyces nodosus]|uniref:ATP-binding protein n=1 Tax=Streptomyces nodosus TaxID=40318 RepID=A0A0B5D6X2_9ACTN|nr:ATP-binding protein [Streptomyces nodosus]
MGDWMAKSAGELAAAAADLAAKAVDTTTRVDLNARWFRDNYEMLLPLGLVLVATFCAQLVRAAIRRDGQAAHLNIASAMRRIVKVNQIAALSGLGWLVPVVAGLGAAIGAFLYWCVMMVRKVGILVLVTLAIFASAGGGWEVARRWRKGWIEATATLVVSKLLMTVIFVLGIAAMGRTEAEDGIAALADVMSGIVITVLVLLCPYAVFKFVHWAADETDGESIHRAGGAGAQIARAHAEKAARKAAAAAATAGTGGVAAAGAAPQGPDATGGGFPGDVAANPTGGGREGLPTGGTDVSPGGGTVKSGLETAVQPAPTSMSDDTSGQVGGSPGQSRRQSTPPTTTPPPQGPPPSSGSQNATSSRAGGPPPPPSGL